MIEGATDLMAALTATAGAGKPGKAGKADAILALFAEALAAKMGPAETPELQAPPGVGGKAKKAGGDGPPVLDLFDQAMMFMPGAASIEVKALPEKGGGAESVVVDKGQKLPRSPADLARLLAEVSREGKEGRADDLDLDASLSEVLALLHDKDATGGVRGAILQGPPIEEAPRVGGVDRAAGHAHGSELSGMMPRGAAEAASTGRMFGQIVSTVASPQWASELGDKVVWLAGRQGSVAELTLTPPSLGSVEVRLNMSGNEAGAQFFSANPAVRDALEAALPRLREMLAAAGLSLGEAVVSGESFTPNQGKERSGGEAGEGRDESGPEGVVAESQGTATLRGGRGMVDLYA